MFYESHAYDILIFFQANNRGSLQIICEYYRLRCPARGTALAFHPLEHLHPLEFHRPGEMVLHIADSTIDLRTCSTSLEVAEVHFPSSPQPTVIFDLLLEMELLNKTLVKIIFIVKNGTCPNGPLILLFVVLSGSWCTFGRGGGNFSICLDCCMHMW